MDGLFSLMNGRLDGIFYTNATWNGKINTLLGVVFRRALDEWINDISYVILAIMDMTNHNNMWYFWYFVVFTSSGLAYFFVVLDLLMDHLDCFLRVYISFFIDSFD